MSHDNITPVSFQAQLSPYHTWPVQPHTLSCAGHAVTSNAPDACDLPHQHEQHICQHKTPIPSQRLLSYPHQSRVYHQYTPTPQV